MPRTYGRKYTRKSYRKPKTYRRRRTYRPRGELKYVDNDLGGNAINITYLPTAAQMRFLNPVAQGTGEGERIGRTISAESVNLKFFVQFSAGGNAFQKVKWMLYLHHDTLGAPPVPATMFVSDTAFNPLPNLDHPKYGRMLKSGSVILDAYHAQREVNVYKKLKFRTTWKGDTDAIADTSRNSLYLIFWSDQNAANYPVLTQGNCRFKYRDN